MPAECVNKIFLPIKAKGKFLYGHKHSEEKLKEIDNCIKTLISYYVITCSSQIIDHTDLELLGTLGEESKDGLNIITDEHGTIVNVKLNGNNLPSHHRIILLHYEKDKFLRSYNEAYDSKDVQRNFALFIAKSLKDEYDKENAKSLINQTSMWCSNFVITSSTAVSKGLQFISPIFKNTVIHRHCRNWRQCLNDDHSRNGFIVLDILLGIIFFLIMNHIQHSGRYFMDLAELIVNKLRGLLELLDGSPAGLKLNVQLNNFLLSCFMYHVDLWWNFIVIVEPAIQYLFFPITMIGLMGFSFQCAMLCDVITLITLHAHCFYIYAAMLYKLELYSIRSLLRIVLGRRLNVLKSETDLKKNFNR